ncbi:MAG: peptidoglycan DD-metalloendopeptidase family protein [Succinivibrionaceae bacterium]|nr:peptidoglycan DD-metalloendopeptidase family protein [Succinivibrionaceae bacterium]
MKSEEYIAFSATQGLWPQPFSRSHSIAISAIVSLALIATVALNHGQSQVDEGIAYDLGGDDAPVLAGGEAERAPVSLMDPTVPLTEIFRRRAAAEGDDSVGAIAAAPHEGQEDYDDLIPMSLLEDPESELGKHVEQLATTQESAPLEVKWYDEEVQRGDTIESILNDLNFAPSVVSAMRDNKDIARETSALTEGKALSFLVDDHNQLLAFVKQLDGSTQVRFQRQSAAAKEFSMIREPLGAHLQEAEGMNIAAAPVPHPAAPGRITAAPSDDGKPAASQPQAASGQKAEEQKPQVPAYQRRGKLVLATIAKGGTFSSSAHSAGLTYTEINQIMKMFKGRVQFTKMHQGDTIRVLFSDTKGKGRINAVEIKTGKHTITTYRSSDDNKFYDEGGKAPVTVGKFRRFPLAGKIRITSNFNPNRRHPVTGVVRPHNGTDFGVPVGTPVLSTADGIVVKATYNRAAGYFVVIRHRDPYTTVYMHLSKLMVKPGQHVKMGQTIARSGNTGLSTGPHLHFELRMGNRPVNAMRVKLPLAEESAVSQKQRKRFAQNVAQYKRDLHDSKLIAKL